MKVKGKAGSLFVLIMMSGCFLFSGISLAGGRESIQNKRIVIFWDEAFPTGKSAKSLSWYQEHLKELGLKTTVADAKEMSDSKFLTKNRFDTLVLPLNDYIPFLATYSIFNFLAEGGNVIISSIPRFSRVYHKEKGTWNINIGKRFDLKRGKIEFQIRFLPWESAQRSLLTSLKINPDLPPYLKSKLPPVTGPFIGEYGLPDKMNMYKHVYKRAGGIRDFDLCGGRNVETAANIILPVYLLPSGEPADFIAYRYHNNWYNDSTLIILGKLGASLLNTDIAGDVLYTSLKLCEAKFPGEEKPSYYQNLLTLHREVSSFGRLFIETYYPLRDLTFKKFYRNKKEFKELKKKMLSCESALSYIMAEKQKIDSLLFSSSDSKEQGERRKKLLIRIEEEKNNFQTIKKQLAKEINQIRYPEEVKITSPLGEMPVTADRTDGGLYTLRKGFFQTCKDLGVNNWFLNARPDNFLPFLNDPEIKKSIRETGIKISPSMSYWRLFHIFPAQGVLNISTGQVTETPRQIYDFERTEKNIRSHVAQFKNRPILDHKVMLGERGLNNKFWGEQAKEEYQCHLMDKYKDIKNLTERWKTNYQNFKDIKLLTRPPKTVSEHSNWEDWTNYREKRHLAIIKFTYETFKKYDPERLVSVLAASTGAVSYPYCGNNFYQATKYMDVNAIDGTALPAKQEWIYFDLNCGKPVVTGEWSGFYMSETDILKGRKKLSGQLWQEVSGGHVGINAWFWSKYGFEANYVDSTGLPTLYGWELKNLVSDFRKFDHILLDGRRRNETEVRILFSDTSRVHEADWTTNRYSSPHYVGVENYYSLMLKLHQPARVIDEEAVLEGADLSKCRLLIVSHAGYLSEELQKLLVEYVKKGGNVLLEGRSGKFDNYGHSSNFLFKEAGIAASFVTGKAIILPGDKFYKFRRDEFAFSPSLFSPEKGKVLIKYEDGRPALVSVPVGKGKVIVSGAPIGLDAKGFDFLTIIMGEIFKEANIIPKYICSNKKLLIREWEYEGEDYLVCAYPEGKGLINKFHLKVRGNHKIIDYLLGAEIPVVFDGEYTSFQGIIPSHSGRVYQLKENFGNKTSLLKQEPVKKKERGKKTASQTSLPYKGYIFTQEPREIKGYLFQSYVVPLTDRTGEAFLVVSKGDEKQKRKVEPGKEYVFFFKEASFSVKCLSLIFIYPEGIDMEIRETQKAPIFSACSFQEQDSDLLLSNGLVELKIIPQKGGRISEYITLPEKVNHLVSTHKCIIGGGIKEHEGRYPGVLYKQPFSYRVIMENREQVKISLAMDKPVKSSFSDVSLLLKKSIVIKKNEAKVKLQIKEYNYSKTPKRLSLTLHPMLSIGGIPDKEDTFFIPTKEGLKILPYDRKAQFFFSPSEPWAACCDKGEKVAYITSFSLDEVETVYVCLLPDGYTFELFALKKEIKPLEALSLNVDFFLIKGIAGIGNFKEGLASHISLPKDSFSQGDEEIRFTVELGSAFLEKKELSGKLSLFKEGKKIKEIGRFNEKISFEHSLEEKFSFPAKELRDGAYEVALSVSDRRGKEVLREKKQILLAGEAKKENARVYNDFKERLEQLKQKYPSKKTQLVEIFILLEEFHSAIEENNKEKILLKRKKINQALKAML